MLRFVVLALLGVVLADKLVSENFLDDEAPESISGFDFRVTKPEITTQETELGPAAARGAAPPKVQRSEDVEDEDDQDVEESAAPKKASEIAMDFWHIDDADIGDVEEAVASAEEEAPVQSQLDADLDENETLVEENDAPALAQKLMNTVTTSTDSTIHTLNQASRELRIARKMQALAKQDFQSLRGQLGSAKRTINTHSKIVKFHHNECKRVAQVASKKIGLVDSMEKELREVSEMRGDDLTGRARTHDLYEAAIDLAMSSSVEVPEGGAAEEEEEEGSVANKLSLVASMLQHIRSKQLKDVQSCHENIAQGKSELASHTEAYRSLRSPTKQARAKLAFANIRLGRAHEKVKLLSKILKNQKVQQAKEKNIVTSLKQVLPETKIDKEFVDSRAQELSAKLQEVLLDTQCARDLSKCTHKLGNKKIATDFLAVDNGETCRELVAACKKSLAGK